MKKTLLTLVSSVAFLLCVNAQVSNYGFSQSAGTYTPITGGTVLGDATSDDERFVDVSVPLGSSTTTGVGLPIGFNFTYNGLVFDRFGVNNNGWISLGQSALTPAVNMVSSTSYRAISATSTATPAFLRNRIAGFSKDLEAQTGAELRTQTIGTAPNRICVIQWKNYSKYPASDSNDVINFQIRLNETTNTVEVVYGTSANNTTNATVQVGLTGTTNADFNNRKAITSWTSSVAGTYNTDSCLLTSTIHPASGLTFTWTVPAACTGTPTAGTASVNGGDSVCFGQNFDLTLTGYTSGVSGITFQWQSATSQNGTFTNINGAITSTYTTSQTVDTYYKCLVSCNGGTAVASSPVFVKMKNYISCYCSTTSSCTGHDAIFNVTLGTLNNTTVCGPGHDSLYTATVPNLHVDSTYTLSVKVDSSYTEHVSVWIDYNKNGSFETSEFFYLGSGNGITIDSTFTVPTNAISGHTRMRVRVRYNTALGDTSACLSYLFGETEDYIVNITGGSSVGITEYQILDAINIYPNPTSGVFNIAATEAKFIEMTISVVDIQGKVVYSSVDKNVSSSYNKQINLEGVAKGLYYIKLNSGKGVKVQKLIIQ